MLLKDRLEGIGWFTYETLRRISKAHPEHEFIFIFDRPWDPGFVFSSNVKPVQIPLPTRHILLFIPWFEVLLPWVLWRQKADLFLSPDGHLSLCSKVPSVAVIHDLNFEHYPEFVPTMVRWYYRWFFPRFARKAKRIVTVSEFTRKDIVAQYQTDVEKIDVAHNGCHQVYEPLEKMQKQQVRLRYSDGKPYFIFIGLIIPRKNLLRLMLAFDIMKERTGSDIQLLVVGSRKWWDEEHEKVFAQMKYKNDLRFLGRKNAEELSLLLGSATALTYVPLFEGFGIPILEAFSAGVPVITSNVTSMPEVSADAALLVDPFNPQEIAEAMERLLKDVSLQESLKTKGFIRRQAFSWDQTAEKLWESIEKAAMSTKKPAP